MRRAIRYILHSLFNRGGAGGTDVSSASSVNGLTLQLPTQGVPMNIGTVFGCVDVLAGAVSSLPLLWEHRKDGVYVADNAAMNNLLNIEPCDHMCAPDFWRMIVQDMLLSGNAYIVPSYDSITGELWRLARADPQMVVHDVMHDTYDVHDVQGRVGGKFDEDEIIHIKNYTADGKTGISTLTYARITTSTALAGDSETLDRFSNGGNVRGFVSNTSEGISGFGKVQDEELDRTAVSLDERFRRGERIVPMPGDAKFNQITLSSQDMQFLESRKFNGLDICRFFRVPPQFVFYETASNYKSSETANVAFLTNTLNPLLRRIETELQRKLITPRNRGKYRIKFEREGLLACDLQSRAKYQAATIGSGIYTVNEWRAKENKPAVKGGDKVLVSANLKDINEPMNNTVTTAPKAEKEEKDDDENE